MSYQAITDIIVNPQIQDLQLSNTVKDSPNQPSVGFADYLASYNAEKANTDSMPAQSDSKIPESAENIPAEKSENLNKTEKSENGSENQVKNDKDAEKISEKSVEKTETDNDAEKNVSELKDYKEADVKNLKKDVPLEGENKSESKKVEAKEDKNSRNKKLSEKDFARLEEITNKIDAETDSVKASAAASSVKNVNTAEKAELESDSKDIEGSEIKISAELPSENALNEIKTSQDNSPEFDFSGNEDKGKKQFALDKDGKIIVEDQRTKTEVSENENKKPVIKTSDIQLANENTAVMSVELNPNAEADILSLNTQTAASNGSNFQAMLSNQLQNVAPEFVKAGNLVLKDNNQGTINLVLHPDDLGNVKIHLSLDGKTLNGHITVATKEALQVFKDNAETLREAFIKNGFDAANFDVAMNNGGSFNQNMDFENQNDGRNLFAKRMYGDSAEGLGAELDSIFENAEDISNYSVNIVA